MSSNLPSEVVWSILQFLPFRHIPSMFLVSSTWAQVRINDLFWREICERQVLPLFDSSYFLPGVRALEKDSDDDSVVDEKKSFRFSGSWKLALRYFWGGNQWNLGLHGIQSRFVMHAGFFITARDPLIPRSIPRENLEEVILNPSETYHEYGMYFVLIGAKGVGKTSLGSYLIYGEFQDPSISSRSGFKFWTSHEKQLTLEGRIMTFPKSDNQSRVRVAFAEFDGPIDADVSQDKSVDSVDVDDLMRVVTMKHVDKLSYNSPETLTRELTPSCYLACYDVTSRASLDELMGWISIIQRSANANVVFVACKCDVEESLVQVRPSDVFELFGDDLILFETSAKRDSETLGVTSNGLGYAEELQGSVGRLFLFAADRTYRLFRRQAVMGVEKAGGLRRAAVEKKRDAGKKKTSESEPGKCTLS